MSSKPLEAAGSGAIISEVIDGQKRYTVALRTADRYRRIPTRCARFRCAPRRANN